MAKILLVEDNPELAKTMVALLTDFGHTPNTTYADAAATTARVEQPDLIILDLHMAGTSGEQVFHQLKDAPETCHIPVIVTSALANAAAIAHSIGADDVLPKPFSIDLLEQRIARVLCRTTQEAHDEPTQSDDQ